MNKIAKILASIALCAAFTSCSLFQSAGNVIKGSQSTIVSSEQSGKQQQAVGSGSQQSEAVATPTKDAVNSPSKDTGNAPSKVTGNAPSKDTSKSPSTDAETMSVSESDLLDKLNGEWTILECPPYSINQDEDYPYVIFDAKEGRFYGSNGCNILNGSFEALGNNELTFNNVLSTMKACQDIEYQYLISTILRDGNKVKATFSQKGDESYLQFSSPAGAPLMTLRKHNMEKLNGKWQVVKIKDVEVDNPEVNLFFDIPELSVHGNTGCNYFNGSILIDPQKDNSISFSQMAVTTRACPDIDTEMALLVALEETNKYKLHDNKLMLYGDSHHAIVTLERAE